MDPQPDGVAAVKLAVVEVLDRHGHPRLAIPVFRWPVTIGRAIDCDLVLDDPHVAPRHATLVDENGALRVVVGETINGVLLKGRRIPAPESHEIAAGDVLQIGGTRVRVRRAADALAPERPLAPEPAVSRWSILVLTLALVGWTAAQRWLNTNPGDRLTDSLTPLLNVLLVLALWCSMWAIGSRLFKHRFDFWPHASIALRYALVASIIGLVLPVAAFSLGWAFLSRVSGIVVFGVVWAMVMAHMRLVLPPRRWVLPAVMGALFVAGLSLLLVRNYQARDRVFTELYVTTLGPPALRLAPAVPTTRFIDEARALKAVLDAHAKDQNGGSSQDDNDDRTASRR
jgi:FHA domain